MGGPFQLLGTWIDQKLSMKTTVEKAAKTARSKLYAPLRTRRYYRVRELVTSYKANVLPHLEFSSGSIYHATDTTLKPLENVQKHFLEELGLPPTSAFLDYNLAPLRVRRDIGLLGLLHSCALGHAHQDFLQLCPLDSSEPMRRTRLQSHRHSRQLVDRVLDLFRRSIFGLVRIYNLLPPDCRKCKHSLCIPTRTCLACSLSLSRQGPRLGVFLIP